MLGSIFYLDPSSESTIATLDSNFSSCFLSGSDELGGGVYHLNSNTALTERKVNMIGIAAIQGGIYYCDSCKMDIQDNTYNTIFCQEGCIVYASSFSEMSFKDSVIENILAVYSGGLITLG